MVRHGAVQRGSGGADLQHGGARCGRRRRWQRGKRGPGLRIYREGRRWHRGGARGGGGGVLAAYDAGDGVRLREFVPRLSCS